MVAGGGCQCAVACTSVDERAVAQGLRSHEVAIVWSGASRTRAELACERRRARDDASSWCVAGVTCRASHRRRPAQVFYRLRDGWDVGMSKPSAFTVPPPLRRCGGGRIRTFISLVSLSTVVPGTRSRTRCEGRSRGIASARAPSAGWDGRVIASEAQTNRASDRDRQSRSGNASSCVHLSRQAATDDSVLASSTQPKRSL